jgi:hypothetical protein
LLPVKPRLYLEHYWYNCHVRAFAVRLSVFKGKTAMLDIRVYNPVTGAEVGSVVTPHAVLVDRQ